MARDLFQLGLPWSELIVRSVLSFSAALILVRLAVVRLDRPLDGIVLALVAGALLTSIRGPDVSVTGGLLVAVVTLSLFSLVLMARVRFPFFERVLVTGPVVVVRDGTLDSSNLQGTGRTDQELLGLLADRGIHKLSEVRLAVFDGDHLLIESKPTMPDDARLAELSGKLDEVLRQVARIGGTGR